MVLVRLPLAAVWLLLLVFVLTPLMAALALLLLLWALLMAPFMLLGALVRNDQAGAEAIGREVIALPEGALSALREAFDNWLRFVTLRELR